MRYEYHNFVDNYKNIKKSKDMAMTRELVVSEISKVIDGRPFLVKRALVSCGISLSNEADKTEIVFVTMFNLAQSECLRRSMAELIYNNQYPVGFEIFFWTLLVFLLIAFLQCPSKHNLLGQSLVFLI